MPLSEKAQKHKTEYNLAYSKKHYKRVPLDLTPEQYAETQAAAQSVSESVNGFIKKSISERIEKIKSNTDTGD